MNQTVPSDFTTTSLGELSFLPSKRSARTVIVPSGSVLVTRRIPCSHVTRRPWRSRVLPLAKFDGCAKDTDRAIRCPPQHPVVWDVAPDQALDVGKPDRTFGERAIAVKQHGDSQRPRPVRQEACRWQIAIASASPPSNFVQNECRNRVNRLFERALSTTAPGSRGPALSGNDSEPPGGSRHLP